jgi:hypothetical protein
MMPCNVAQRGDAELDESLGCECSDGLYDLFAG